MGTIKELHICYRESLLSMFLGYDGKVIMIVPENIAEKWIKTKKDSFLFCFSTWKMNDFISFYGGRNCVK